MKKILWVCNTPLPEIQNAVGIRNYNEGWLIGISNQLRKREDIVFHYAFPQSRYKRTFNQTIDGITFWGFYNFQQIPYKIEKEREQTLRTIIAKVNPDIIHIFGTEYSHTLECIKSVPDKKKVVVSVQGLVSELATVYTKGIPFKDRLAGKFEGTEYRCILTEKFDFYKRGVNERNVLLRIQNVIGRTDWDKKCVQKRNAGCKYYHCSETLRDVFYEDSWDIRSIQRHSVFVSQAGYSIKGLHILIPALALIKRRYPDVLVYVAGDKAFLKRNTPYGCYIKKLIKQYSVEENIVFLGFFTAEKIKQQLLKTHVMVMPSLLENSPNSIGEAMMMGVPVVAAKVGGIPSLMSDGKEGYLYACMDKKDLARKICKIFLHDDLALKFSKNGRKTGAKLYNRSNNLDRLLEIYDEIIHSDKRNRK